MAIDEKTIVVGVELYSYMEKIADIVDKLYGALEIVDRIMKNSKEGYEGKATEELDVYWVYMQQNIYKLVYFYSKSVQYISKTQEIMQLVDEMLANSME